ncbi:t-SNARE [Aspergillus egyptiacus]|nr:t-SNARE [Aspergillus egyptiacus]
MSYGDYRPYGNGNNYGQNPYAQDLEQGNNYEMQPTQDPFLDLLSRVKGVSDGINNLKAKRDGQLAAAQNAMLESNTGREDHAAREYLETIQDELYQDYRALTEELRRIKGTPGADDAKIKPQIGSTDRKLRSEMEQYQKSQSEFSRRLKEQVRRRYQIANPEASPEEIDQGVEGVLAGTEQSFQVAGARSQRANDVRQNVQERSNAIRKIEQDVVEVARLMETLAEQIHQQEPAVEQINRGAENVAQDLQNANTQLGQAVESARKARRWKWYALIIISKY